MGLNISKLKQHVKLSSVKFMLYFRRIFGCYSRISKSKLKCLLFKLYCVFLTITPAMIHLLKVKFISPHIILSFIEYVSLMSVSLITAEKFLINYCNNMKTAVAIMGVDRASIIPLNVIKIVLILIASRVVVLIFKVLQVPMVSIQVHITTSYMLIAKDINYLSVIIVFAILHNRMKIIRKSMEMKTIPVNIIGRNEIKTKAKLIRKFILMYKHLMDNMLSADRNLQCLESIILIAVLPKSILQMQRTIRNFILGRGRIASLIDFISNILCVTCPAILAEMTSIEVNRIKQIIVKQLRQCSDESLRFELRVMLEYITRRPFKHTIFGTIPIDMSLPIGIISLSITYVIVYMQLNIFNF